MSAAILCPTMFLRTCWTRLEHVAKVPNTSRVRYTSAAILVPAMCIRTYWTRLEHVARSTKYIISQSLANLFLLCAVCLEELKINLKQRSTAFAQLLIKQQNEACGWKYLHNFYVFELTCIFVSDPPLKRKQTKTSETETERESTAYLTYKHSDNSKGRRGVAQTSSNPK